MLKHLQGPHLVRAGGTLRHGAAVKPGPQERFLSRVFCRSGIDDLYPVSTTNWHLPCTSTRIISCAAATADFQHTTEWSSGWRAEMKHFVLWKAASQVVLVVKNPPVNAGDMRDVYLITGSGRSPGGGHDNPLLYSCLENPTVGYSSWGCKESAQLN